MFLMKQDHPVILTTEIIPTVNTLVTVMESSDPNAIYTAFLKDASVTIYFTRKTKMVFSLVRIAI